MAAPGPDLPASPAPLPREARAARLLVGGAWLLLCAPLLTGGVPTSRDLLLTYLPMRVYAAARLGAGALPGWFPYEGLGVPFLGQVVDATFHPFTALYLLLPATAALKLELALGLLLALGGQLLLARRLGLGPAPAAASAVAFGYSGYLLSLTNSLVYLQSLALLPVVGTLAANALTRERPRPWVGGLALALGAILLEGDLQGFGLAGLVTLLIAAVLGAWRQVGRLAAAALLAVALASCTLLPGQAVFLESTRSAWVSGKAILSTHWALLPGRLPELVIPGWFGAGLAKSWLLERVESGPGAWADSIYAGSVALALGGWGAARGGRLGRAGAGLALLGLWLALGAHGGLHPLARRLLPPLSSFRFPEKYLALWAFGLALAAGAGWEALHQRASPAQRAGLAGGGLALGLALLAPVAGWHLGLLEHLAGAPLPGPVAESARAGLVAGALAAGAGLLVLAAIAGRPRLALAAPLLLAAQLWPESRELTPLVEPELVEARPAFCQAVLEAAPGPGRPRATSHARHFERSFGSENLETLTAVSRNLFRPDSNALCGLEALGSNLPGTARRYRDLFPLVGEPSPGVEALFGVGFAVEDGPPAPNERVLAALPRAGYRLVERPSTPRVYLGRPRYLGTEEEARREVLAHPERCAESPVLVGTGPAPAEGPLRGQARLVAYAPEAVVIEAELAEPGVVVLNDLYAPGWSATLDGAPAPILPANHAVRGVLAPAGAHRLELRYRTPRLTLGLTLSGLALALCLGLVLPLRRRG